MILRISNKDGERFSDFPSLALFPYARHFTPVVCHPFTPSVLIYLPAGNLLLFTDD